MNSNINFWNESVYINRNEKNTDNVVFKIILQRNLIISNQNFQNS